MHIAYYFEPWVELGRPYLRYHNLRYQLGPQIERMARLDKDVKVSIVLGEGTYAKCLADGYEIPGAEFCVIPSDALKEVFPDYATAADRLARGTHTDQQAQAMIDLIHHALGGHQPDVFVSFLSPAPFVEALWTDTLVLFAEFGMFSRIPYPRSFYFDAFGMFGKSYIARFAPELQALKPSADSEAALKALRNTIQKKALKPNLPKLGVFSRMRRNRHNILLPLQFSRYFGFDTCSDYPSQYDFLVDVLERTPVDVGVVVTEHNGWEPVVTEHNEEFLSRKYPNFISTSGLRNFTNLSQFLILECDAIASVSSSVGLQAAFWEKPLFALGNSHLNTFSAGPIEAADSVIADHAKGRFDGAISHLLERYYVSENYAYDPDWSLDFYKRSLALHRSGAKNFDFYRNVDEPKALYAALQSAVRPKKFKEQVEAETKPKARAATQALVAPHLERARREFASHDYISFDIFDTLIQRPLIMPHQLFMLMQPEAKEIVADKAFEFHKLRRLSEHLCRQETGHDEVHLAEIYEVLQRESGISGETVDRLMALERRWELRLCEPRASGRELFDLALTMGKKILIVSDFYMGSEDLAAILHATGYAGWTQLIVSCEHRVSKKSGLLYGKLLADFFIEPRQILHVGDNEHSDVEKAAEYGISSLKIGKGSDLFFANKTMGTVWKREEKRVTFPTDDLHRTSAVALGLIINRLYGSPSGKDANSAFGGNVEDLGYSVFGPIFLGFALHLKQLSEEHDNDVLMFLARDGSILKKAFDIVCRHTGSPISTKYVYTSRRALSFATMFDEKDVFAALGVGFKPTPLESLLTNRFGLLREDFDASCLEGSDIESLSQIVEVNGSDLQLRKVLSNLMGTILARATAEREAALDYFRTQFHGARNPALVDIGYTGSIQRHIRRLLDINPSCYFLLTHLKAKETVKEGTFIDGYLGKFIDHTEPLNPFNSNISILEAVCSSGEASLERFEFVDGKAVPKLRENRLLPNRRGIFAHDIQKGAMDFVDDFMSRFSGDLDLFDFSPDFVTKWLFTFLKTPSYRDALLFNGLEHEDLYSGYEKRFIVADIVGALRRGQGKLSPDTAKLLIATSDWKQGARAILPPKAGTERTVPEGLLPIEYRYVDPSSIVQEDDAVEDAAQKKPRPAKAKAKPAPRKKRMFEAPLSLFLAAFKKRRG